MVLFSAAFVDFPLLLSTLKEITVTDFLIFRQDNVNHPIDNGVDRNVRALWKEEVWKC